MGVWRRKSVRGGEEKRKRVAQAFSFSLVPKERSDHKMNFLYKMTRSKFTCFIRVFTQRRRRRQRKRHLTSEFALPQTLSRLFHLVKFVKCWQVFLEVEF